jgi:hypothetical protein
MELKPGEDPAAQMTLNELYVQWCHWRGPVVAATHRKRMGRYWREIAGRPLGTVKLERIARDPALLPRFQDQLTNEALSTSLRGETLKRCAPFCAGDDAAIPMS